MVAINALTPVQSDADLSVIATTVFITFRTGLPTCGIIALTCTRDGRAAAFRQ
jgi:hypothetical protein